MLFVVVLAIAIAEVRPTTGNNLTDVPLLRPTLFPRLVQTPEIEGFDFGVQIVQFGHEYRIGFSPWQIRQSSRGRHLEIAREHIAVPSFELNIWPNVKQDRFGFRADPTQIETRAIV